MLRRDMIGALVGLSGTLAVSGAKAASALKAREVRLGKLRLLVSQPAKPARGGVLLHPTIEGVNPYMHTVAADLVADGYAAVIWDPYDGDAVPPNPPNQLGALAMSKRLNDNAVMADLHRTVDYMFDALKIQKLAAIGWCMGGRYAILHAGYEPRLSAVAAYFPTIYPPKPIPGARGSKLDFPGQVLDETTVARQVTCPVQIFRPGTDLTHAVQYAELEAALYQKSQATVVSYFPAATHGFTYQLNTPGNIAAASLGWSMTESLFSRALKA